MFSSPLRLALALPLAAMILAASPAPRASPVPVHGLPKILSVSLPQREFRAGQTVRGNVTTSPNVGYVEARINYRNMPMHRDGMGQFSLAYTIPWWLPPWLRHGWTLQVIARSVDGVEVKEYFPIVIH